MRCYICDTEDESITFDYVDGRFTACNTCRDIIYDCVASYDEEEEEDEETDSETDLDYTEW